MTQKNRTPRRSSAMDAVTGSGAGQVPAHPHDSGSQANETVDGLDASTESLRHADRRYAFREWFQRYRKNASI
jgi:hypothetical protein